MSDDSTPDWNLEGQSDDSAAESDASELTSVLAWSCAGDAVEPDIVYDMPGYIESVAYHATQTCAGTFGLQRACARLQEWNYGLHKWENRTTFRCGAWTTSSYSIGGGVVHCSDLDAGKFRTRGKGEADTPQGIFREYGNSNEVILCNN